MSFHFNFFLISKSCWGVGHGFPIRKIRACPFVIATSNDNLNYMLTLCSYHWACNQDICKNIVSTCAFKVLLFNFKLTTFYGVLNHWCYMNSLVISILIYLARIPRLSLTTPLDVYKQDWSVSLTFFFPSIQSLIESWVDSTKYSLFTFASANSCKQLDWSKDWVLDIPQKRYYVVKGIGSLHVWMYLFVHGSIKNRYEKFD